MRVAVFAGPTLWDDPVLKTGAIEWHPPASQGDVYRVARTKPFAIGLIDGRFEMSLSVWHKEILWALSRGIHVYGAASMGALRAAELAPFGMIGIGAIFRDFKSGRLRDDDEVAVLHGPQELRYCPLTEAMVDVRATIAAAQAARVISAKSADALLHSAKATFFKDRTWEHTLQLGSRLRLPKGELSRLAVWLPANRVERKRLDARALIRALRRLMADAPGPHRAAFSFSHTVFWQTLIDDHRAETPLR